MKYQIFKSILFSVFVIFFFSNYSFAAEEDPIKFVEITVYSDTVAFDVVPGYKNVIVTIRGPSNFYWKEPIETSVTIDLPQSEDGSGILDGEYPYQITGLTNTADNNPESDRLDARLSYTQSKQKGIIIIKNGEFFDSIELN